MNYLRHNRLGVPYCLTAEGGTSGKNTSTDQRQIQLTTGTTGANSPNQTATEGGAVNSGLSVSNTGFGSNTVNVTDQGAVERAFTFAESVTEQVGKVLAGNAATTTATVNANTDALKTYAGAIAGNTDTGAAANTNKTFLYLGIAAAALAALYFIFRR
jgi:hypothetical protein